jgi:large subunit ribosomal protein L6
VGKEPWCCGRNDSKSTRHHEAAMTKLSDQQSFQKKCTTARCTRQHTMFAPARRRFAQNVSRDTTDRIPNVLIPAPARSCALRSFTTTSPCRSKIGSAPLSVPPGVTFQITTPPNKANGQRGQAMSTVRVQGPLGELSMQIPSYIHINQDPALTGPTLSIENSTDAKQKAMWGG